MSITITIDTREQTPWVFPPGVCTRRGTLRTGDYAVAGDAGFAIERKSLDDYAGTIGSGWERFLREIARMDGWPARVIIVEGDARDLTFYEAREREGTVLVPPQHSHHQITPQFAIRRTAELSMMGVCVLFAGDAELAATMALAILRQRAAQIQDQQGGNNGRVNPSPR